ncbi:formimidoylglutamate deiminase [Azotobacter beijerinckii]|uniref:Formimidoylglutamate deiminase n=1 Tax=Azotobacter beijerinckii TaxID=170623 RepID=A0A1H6VDG1_9GAMM|nr:formimidoylglutamate deiminase [Azotobacter beijerinckii]SEJ01024.1 formimidoylglutamate deiminase [Azotobacter beijerinckii]
MTITLFAERALLPGGWARDVRLEIDAAGLLGRIEPDARAEDAERLRGPLLPGLPNLHSHAFQRAMAGLTEVAFSAEDSFWNWRERMYRLVARLDPEQFEAIARQLYIELLKAGYSSVAEFHYLHHDRDGRPYADPIELSLRLARAARESGIGLTLVPVLYSHSGFGGLPPGTEQRRFILDTDGYLDLLARLRPALEPAGQHLGRGFHSLRAVTPGQIARVLAASPIDGPIHLHIAEQQKEVDDCLAWSGRRPLQWLFEHCPVDQRWCLVHATQVQPDELARLAESGAVAGLCPTTEANLGDGLFPATDYLALGGHLGIGSDSQVSVSVVEELRWLEYGQRLRDRRRNRLVQAGRPAVGAALYQAALSGGAQALGQPVGALEVGRRADLLVLDGADPYLANAEGDQILNRWLFAGGDRQVRDVMVAGRWVVREGHHADEERTARAFAGVLATLL